MSKSAVVRGASMATDIFHKLDDAVRRHHGVDEDLHLLAQPAGDPFIDTWARDLVAFGASQRNVYVVPVDYDLAHTAQIEAASFDWITEYDGNLIRKEPIEHLMEVPKGQIEQRITLVDPEGSASTEEMLSKMDRMHLRPTVSHETLAFAKAHPDIQRKHPLVGLGSVWAPSSDYRVVLCLYENLFERSLILSWYEDQWDSDYRFPAVRKS